MTDGPGEARLETATVTLLFCDLVGSTELLTRVGDDAADAIRRALFEALSRAVDEHRGAIVKTMGDGMMVAFRSSAADAVACAAAMQRAVSAIERDGELLGLRLRIGISSGEASHESGDWFGTPVVEAQRLESEAAAGQILVSSVVRTLVGNRGGVQFRDAGTRELKGFARPTHVAEVVWDRATGEPAVAVRRHRGRWRLRASPPVIGVALAAAVVVVSVATWSLTRGTDDDEARALAGPIATPAGYTPRLEPRACPPELAGDGTIECHDLVVPEDRSNPTGRQLRILVSVAPSNVSPAGVPTLSLARPIDGVITTNIREYGDSVTMDIRGLGALDELTCREVNAVMRPILALPLYGPEANTLLLDATEQCGKRLVSEGYNLDAYATEDILNDVRDLVIAMRWEEINIQAGYLWTAVAVELSIRYPGLVRAAMLPEPIAPDTGFTDEQSSRYDSALTAYYNACRQDEACVRAFPDLESALAEAHAKFNRDPVLVTTADPAGGPDIPILIDGDRLVEATVLALAEHSVLPTIAALLVSDDESSFRATADFLVHYAPLNADAPLAFGHSIICRDRDPLVVRGRVAANEAAYPLFEVFARDPVLGVCSRWPTHARVYPEKEAPPAIDAPAFIITGAFNPYASSDYAQRTARWFADATVAVFPSLSTNILEDGPPCIRALRLAFLRNPAQELDVDGCIAAVPRLEFAGTQ